MNKASVMRQEGESFSIKDCALAAIATGSRAQNLRELRDNLMTIHPGCIYYHFWGSLLRPRFDDPEYHNDFAIWSYYALQDPVLAERLGIIHPGEFLNLEALREHLIDLIEERLDELAWVPWTKPDKQFYFVRSQIVVFDANLLVKNPQDMARILPELSVGSIFYHFIDARRRTPEKMDDFRNWLLFSFQGYDDLCHRLDTLDPFFSSLVESRSKLTKIFQEYFRS